MFILSFISNVMFLGKGMIIMQRCNIEGSRRQKEIITPPTTHSTTTHSKVQYALTIE